MKQAEVNSDKVFGTQPMPAGDLRAQFYATPPRDHIPLGGVVLFRCHARNLAQRLGLF